jgi:hypothetical protein
MAPQSKMTAAQQASPPPAAPELQVAPGSVVAAPTWLSMPPTFVPSCSPPMVHRSDLNLTDDAILSYLQRSSNYSLPEEIRHQSPMSSNYFYTGDLAPSDRTREIKQLKEQWHRVNRTVNAFQGSWMKAQHLRASGEFDELVMEKVMAFYEANSKEGQFKFMACWKVLRDQPKWLAYNEDLNGTNKRKTEAVDLTSSTDVVSDLPRSGGCKKAKEERSGKEKGKASSSTMDEIDKCREV